ncbi:MAG: hypothetical protein ACTSRS_17485 [Candidatus Helarchaeota archaeon]
MFNGKIQNISYNPQLRDDKPLKIYEFKNFDINNCAAFGLIKINPSDCVAYTKWVSPKRTRSYPFARIYNIYGFNTKIISIIPIIKDEGKDSMNNDRINAITFSWMNLLNIYIILSYYESAEKLPPNKRKTAANRANNKSEIIKTEYITNQKFNNDYVKKKIQEISQYHMSALHWNTKHFQEDFEKIWNKSIECYQKISKDLNVELHSFKKHKEVLHRFQKNGKFDIETFKKIMDEKSKKAQYREALTNHKLEFLANSNKAILNLVNFLGGTYYLTCDEILIENGLVIIQESKNSPTKKLPQKNDIKDGLFKLILFSNIETLEYNEKEIKFKTRLKLTGNLNGDLILPASELKISTFVLENDLNNRQKDLLIKLNRESEANDISIHIQSNRT